MRGLQGKDVLVTDTEEQVHACVRRVRETGVRDVLVGAFADASTGVGAGVGAEEARLRHREPSTAPARAAEKVLRIHGLSDEARQRFSTFVHWSYGTGWGWPAPPSAPRDCFHHLVYEISTGLTYELLGHRRHHDSRM